MSRILLLSLFLPSIALAQGGSSGLVRHYPFDHSGTMERLGATLWLTFDQTVAATITAETGQVFTVTGTPVKVTDGTWPAGLSGIQGSGWLLSGSSAQSLKTSSIPDPTGSFSGVITYLHQSSNYGYVITNIETTKSWGVFSLPSSARFYYSKTDSGASYLEFPSGCVCMDTACFLAFTYQYITDGSSVLTLYCNGLTPAVKSNTEGPMYAGGNPLRIGDNLDTRNYKFPGVLQHVAYWNGVVLTASQVATMRAQWLGTMSTTGNIPTVTSATPPAVMLAPPGSGTEPFLGGMPANTVQVGSPATGKGGLYGTSAITNLCQRSSFETCTQNTNTEPDGWTVSETAGSGTANVACSAATKAHGLNSVGATISAADGAASITGACLTVTGATAYRLSGYFRTTAGTGAVKLQLAEYSDACSTLITTTDVATGVPTSAWSKLAGNRTTDASAIRAKVVVSWTAGAAQTTYVDAVQLRAGSVASDAYCGADTDASAVCTTTTIATGSPISANGSMTVAATMQSPWAGTDLAADAVLWTDGNATAANTYALTVSATTDEPAFWTYDTSSGSLSVSPDVANWAAATDYTIKASNPPVKVWWNSAWATTTAGAGTGYRSASQTNLNLCGSNSAGSDVWTRDLNIYRRIAQ